MEIELTRRQMAVLEVVVDQYRASESAVTAEEIGDSVDRHSGTIRKETQSLQALDLIEGITGPKGGYKPTVEAYRFLDRQSFDTAENLTLAHDYTRIDVTVAEIDFTSVNHPDQCHAQVAFREPIDDFDVGDPILIGPTPNSELVVGGEITTIDHQTNELQLSVSQLEAPLTT
ncbi:TrmB family transcriptional regulator [Halobacterium sp. KA-4]|uniref:TrmB family transcriptional regulator n=1 Tax=Halobacterium sp. KA-4 TaxID=2896367 RepID=UPI001E3DCD3E|nr:TrmB family transcriptional regulator [Halobacterium sp. KA-4]MCD2201446.1 TrmB family transcriptional regulator [Halobacterium sp. KA-4]